MVLTCFQNAGVAVYILTGIFTYGITEIISTEESGKWDMLL